MKSRRVLTILSLIVTLPWAAEQLRAQSLGKLALATKEHPWTNSLGQPFVPVPGTKVLFCVWDTRVGDFQAFVEATGHQATSGMYSLRSSGYGPHGNTWRRPGFTQGQSHPVCGVNWEDAKAFCRWLTEKERQAGLLTEGQFYRLPTDAEWSSAVGLGLESGETPKDKDAKITGVYPWGNSWPPPDGAGNYAGVEASEGDWPNDELTIAGYRDNYPRTSPVGSFKANRYGLFDMGGNLWQWCEDWYSEDREGRVLRGGSWNNHDSDYLLASKRSYCAPTLRHDRFGFRCVLAGIVSSRESPGERESLTLLNSQPNEIGSAIESRFKQT